jgi:hypothetical protein
MTHQMHVALIEDHQMAYLEHCRQYTSNHRVLESLLNSILNGDINLYFLTSTMSFASF